MDLKPIVTCSGDKDVCDKLNPQLERRLPETATEWRRSFGRPPKFVKLKAMFVKLHESMLSSNIESASSLHKQPFFHIYYTDCQDADDYKTKVKDSIYDWQRKLRDRNIADWLVIQVLSQDSVRGSKPKIPLPRSAVFDKLKSDFGGKSNDRIIQLWEPEKENQVARSTESWQSLIIKLRQLLLISFNRHLGRFEERVRSLREKRTEHRWTFTTYFLLHEELSFVFEMLGLYEEALIQYDEIDALLTQMIINSQFGESLQCIDVYSKQFKCCDGVPLSNGTQAFLRDLIKTQEATFLDLRNYLFSRQCNLLLYLHRPWEIAQRTLDFLHNLVHELAILKISLPTGGSACCIILTCLEVLKRCRKRFHNADMEYSLYFAQLYEYAKKKLDEVGNVCALLPDMTATETELHDVCLLIDGIGKTQTEDEVDPHCPSKKLQAALSSKNLFQSLYLELTEKAIQIYKNIGRARAAKLLGKDLAQFHCCRGEFHLAEPLLVGVYKMYKNERWTLLATQSLVQLAECQKQLQLIEKYASSCSLLACEQSLPEDKRSFYTQELLQVIRDTIDSDKPLMLRAEPLLKVEDVNIELLKGIGSVGECISVVLKLHSALEEEVTCRHISFSLETSDLKRTNQSATSKRSSWGRFSVVEDDVSSVALSEEDLSDKPTYGPTAEFEQTMARPIVAQPHRSVPDTPPVTCSTEDLNVVYEDRETEYCLECSNVPLKHGTNVYNLTVQVGKEGEYNLRQLCVEIGNLNYVWPQLILRREAQSFAIVSDPPNISLVQDRGVPLILGPVQHITVNLSTGPGSVVENSVLEISFPSGLSFLPIQTGVVWISSTLENQQTKSSKHYSLAVPPEPRDKEGVEQIVALVTLPSCGPYESVEFDVVVQAPLSKQSEHTEEVVHKLSFCCKWLRPTFTSHVTSVFYRPFTVRHVLHSSAKNRFLQIILSSVHPKAWLVSKPDLTLPAQAKVNTTPFHKTDESQIVAHKQDLSFLWKLESELGSADFLDCEFRASFNPKPDEDDSMLTYEHQEYVYDFIVEYTQTLYTFSCRVEPPEGAECLVVGCKCKLKITLTSTPAHQVDNPTESEEEKEEEEKEEEEKEEEEKEEEEKEEEEKEEEEKEEEEKEEEEKEEEEETVLMYKVDVNSNTWMIAGRTTGVVSLPRVAMATRDVILDVMPLTGGNLPLPDVKLMKYTPSREESGARSSSTGESAPCKFRPREAPVVAPFACGQVYNSTQALQVRVFPSNTQVTVGL